MQSTTTILLAALCIVSTALAGVPTPEAATNKHNMAMGTPNGFPRTLRASVEFQAFEAQLKLGKDFNEANPAIDPIGDIPAIRAQFSTVFGNMVPAVPGINTATETCGSVQCTIFSQDLNPDLTAGVVLYLHGGGYYTGDLFMYTGIMGHMADDLDLPVVFVDYSLAPEVPLPGATNDAVGAYQWLLGPKGVPANKVVMMGDSAGGGLTLLTLQALVAGNIPQPACAIVMSAYTDLSLSGESSSVMTNFEPMLDISTYTTRTSLMVTGSAVSLAHPSVSPVFGDFTGVAPLFVSVGQNEILLSDSLRVASRARGAGVDVHLEVAPHMSHVFPVFGDIFPEAKRARARFAEFIGEHL